MMAIEGDVVKSADRWYHRCWECDEEFLVTTGEERDAARPVLYCPHCGSVRVEPTEGMSSVWTLWARALHAAPVH